MHKRKHTLIKVIFFTGAGFLLSLSIAQANPRCEAVFNASQSAISTTPLWAANEQNPAKAWTERFLSKTVTSARLVGKPRMQFPTDPSTFADRSLADAIATFDPKPRISEEPDVYQFLKPEYRLSNKGPRDQRTSSTIGKDYTGMNRQHARFMVSTSIVEDLTGRLKRIRDLKNELGRSSGVAEAYFAIRNQLMDQRDHAVSFALRKQEYEVSDLENRINNPRPYVDGSELPLQLREAQARLEALRLIGMERIYRSHFISVVRYLRTLIKYHFRTEEDMLNHALRDLDSRVATGKMKKAEVDLVRKSLANHEGEHDQMEKAADVLLAQAEALPNTAEAVLNFRIEQRRHDGTIAQVELVPFIEAWLTLHIGVYDRIMYDLAANGLPDYFNTNNR